MVSKFVDWRNTVLNLRELRMGSTKVTATPDEINQVCDGVGPTATATNLTALTDGSVPQAVTVPISSAQLLDWHNTPIPAIAGVAGKVFIPIAGMLTLLHGATPYTAADPVRVAVATDASPAGFHRWLRGDATEVLTATDYNPSVFLPQDVAGTPDPTVCAGGGLVVYGDTPLLAGDGTALLTLWYSALTDFA